ncbi:Protein required for ethanol metabolism [Zalaria obscura]|uniref:Protein required for ethanol metabolism n=1 Tax=Zalaria obscura TaxID=2024903 RepID=A0ACC3S4U9_9PEZI
MASFMRWYQLKLAQKPLLTQSVTTAVLFATGDVMAQQGVEGRGLKQHDLARTGRMAFYGGCIFGPAATTWFGFLQRRVVFPGRPNLEILARVGLDQGVFASCNLFCFLSSMALMEGTSPQKKLESTYTQALSKNWMVWPWVQMANFKFTPLEHRVLVVNVISLGWNCYLSYLNSQGAPSAANSEKEPELPPS